MGYGAKAYRINVACTIVQNECDDPSRELFRIFTDIQNVSCIFPLERKQSTKQSGSIAVIEIRFSVTTH